MKFYDNIPIYIQIANDIKEKVISGQLKEAEKLPSIREYSVMYEVTSLTVQRAMQQLEADGVIRTKKGVGCFVMEESAGSLKVRMVSAQIKEFITRMKSMGVSDDTILVLVKEALRNE
ncbi:GntR family transcriptional regulator [Anaerocolumna sp. AGMB13025]|uniref:GntR family transcriptional regulator n=1 Tax=Anaerocolumna sp. AGMB13025 TaxID=3039116 RepID=UPI00241EA425|nr:GntR family transcriptional regulator [Anaerocolumna sp. AGMB13025]WFR58545.1 GntR family transcriptional regulator [Anaerocolumna sp. AGMB13025]